VGRQTLVLGILFISFPLLTESQLKIDAVALAELRCVLTIGYDVSKTNRWTMLVLAISMPAYKNMGKSLFFRLEDLAEEADRSKKV